MTKKKKKYPLWFEDPFETMSRMHEEMHRVMRGFWERPFEFRVPEIKIPELKLPKIKTIPVDIGETEKELLVRADLPGFTKDEIKLKLTSNTLDISAEKKKTKIEKGKTFYRQERSYGAARRMLTLPEEVKADKTKAKFENGVLEIILPKAKIKKKEKKVKIQ